MKPLQRPKGRRLGDRAIMALQQAEKVWFIFNYQERYNEQDDLIAKDLRSIEQHCGLELQEIIEIARG